MTEAAPDPVHDRSSSRAKHMWRLPDVVISWVLI